MNDALHNQCKSVFETIFYNESHSETGSYIYAEKSMRDFATALGCRYAEYRQRINEDVIDKYVTLYKKVFQ